MASPSTKMVGREVAKILGAVLLASALAPALGVLPKSAWEYLASASIFCFLFSSLAGLGACAVAVVILYRIVRFGEASSSLVVDLCVLSMLSFLAFSGFWAYVGPLCREIAGKL